MRRRSLLSAQGIGIDIEKYMTVVALEDGLTVTINGADCQYCIDGSGKWIALLNGIASVEINEGQTMSFKGKINSREKYNSGYKGSVKFTISKRCNLTGNCMALRFGDDADQYDTGGGFYELFRGNSTIIEVSDNFLPATTVTTTGYTGMFSYCTNLVKAPKLPATNLYESCYGCSGHGTGSGFGGTGMFEGCTSLVEAPELPATKVPTYGYVNMFRGCTSLKVAPELPATSIGNNCYSGMFAYCSSLVEPPSELPAKVLASGCYGVYGYYGSSSANYSGLGMFQNCTSLIRTPKLLAPYLKSMCYMNMFRHCSSIERIDLYAICTSDWSCSSMFDGCSNVKLIIAMTAETKGHSSGVPLPWNSTTKLIKNPVKSIFNSGSFDEPIKITCKSLNVSAEDIDGNTEKSTLTVSAIIDAEFSDGTIIQDVEVPPTSIDSPIVGKNFSSESIIHTFEYTLGDTTIEYSFVQSKYKDYRVVCKYNITDISAATTLTQNSGLTICDTMIIDGVEYPFAKTHQFDSTGDHEVIFVVPDDKTITYGRYLINGRVKSVDFRDVKVTQSEKLGNMDYYSWEYFIYPSGGILKSISLPIGFIKIAKIISNSHFLSKIVMKDKIAPEFASKQWSYPFSSLNTTETIESKWFYVPVKAQGYDTGDWAELFVKNTSYPYAGYFKLTHDYTPMECTSLVEVSANNTIGNATSVEVSYKAITNGIDNLTGDWVTDVEVEGVGRSLEFETNTTDATITKEVTFEYLGASSLLNIEQLPSGTPGFTIDLNDQWQMGTSEYSINPDEDVYEGCFESFSNYGKKEIALMYIDIVDLNNFKLYIRSYAPSNTCVIVSQLDQTIDSSTSYEDSTLVKDYVLYGTDYNTSVSDINGYKLVEFNDIGMGTHRITIAYQKKSNSTTRTDKGYVLIPKIQY